MHEYSLVSALLDRVRREAAARGATRVRRVYVRVGEIAGVEVGLLRTAFDTCRAQTVCGDAELDVQVEAARWTCPRCGAEIPRGERLACAACNVPAGLSAGDALVLDRIEMEVP
jgi:hydrogenase nickel incorporation protein HypA/HybF